MTIPTCPCGHPLDDEGYCLVAGPDGTIHRVPRMGNRCVDCGLRLEL